MRLRTLGQSLVEVSARRVTPESDVLFAIVLLLTSKLGHPVSRVDICDLLWPDSDDDSARHRLRQAIYQLRKIGVPLNTLDNSVVVRKADVQIDYLACRENREALSGIVFSTPHLEVLPQYSPQFSDAFARWVEAERDRVRATLIASLHSAIADCLAQSDHERVVAFARACRQQDSLDENATFVLAESLAILGRSVEAVRELDQHRDALRALGERCPKELVDLRQRILDASKRTKLPNSSQGDLVGRGAIIKQLDTWASRQPAARPVLALVGEAGIGKTRLVGEAARIAAIHDLEFVEYRPNANGQGRSLVGVLDLLPRLLSLPGAVGCQPESYAQLTHLAGLAKRLPLTSVESGFGYALVRRAVLDLFEAVLAERGIIVSIDDAHTLDRPSLDILLDATQLPGRSLALLLTLRPVGLATALLENRSDFELVRVPRLGLEESRLLLTRDLSVTLAIRRAETIDLALDLAHGNPYFLTELSEHCRGDDAFAVLPESLHKAIEHRLETLTPNARLLLETCAVLGQNSTLARIETVLDLPAHAMSAALSELDNAGLLAARDGWVGCRHDLIGDVVIAGIGTPLGVYLHRRCATILDRDLNSTPFASLAWDCAEHWAAADERGRALELTELIVDRLLSLGMAEAAADLCRKAERFCRTPGQNAERHRRLGQAYRLLQDWGSVITALESRNHLLGSDRPLSDKYSQEELDLLEARWWGRLDLKVLTEAKTRASDVRAPIPHRLQMGVLALIVADNSNRSREGPKIFSALKELAPLTTRDEVEYARAETIYHCSFGDLDEAIRAARRVVELERATSNGANLIRPLRWLAKPLMHSGNLNGAVEALTESFGIASKLSLRSEMLQTAFYISDVAIECENPELARDWIPICEGLERDIANGYSRAANSLYLMARMALVKGDLAESENLLDRAQNLSQGVRLTRAEESILALDVLLRLKTGRSLGRSALRKLCRLHLVTRRSGFRDFELGALLFGLLHLGDVQRARELSREYTMVRRTRLPFHSVLVAARDSIDVVCART